MVHSLNISIKFILEKFAAFAGLSENKDKTHIVYHRYFSQDKILSRKKLTAIDATYSKKMKWKKLLFIQY